MPQVTAGPVVLAEEVETEAERRVEETADDGVRPEAPVLLPGRREVDPDGGEDEELEEAEIVPRGAASGDDVQGTEHVVHAVVRTERPRDREERAERSLRDGDARMIVDERAAEAPAC